MSIHHLEAAATLEGMAPSKKLAFMAICDDADKVTRLGAPGLEAVHLWSGITSKSQVLAVIAELVQEGYLERVSPGRKGRKAVFRVFAKVACCALHAPASNDDEHSDTADAIAAAAAQIAGSDQPDPDQISSGSAAQDPEAPQIGSGQPDPAVSIGSGKGSGKGSGLDRTPPVSPVSPELQTPQPPPSGGAVDADVVNNPTGCPKHPDKPGTNCRGCKTSPRSAARQQAKAKAEADRLAEQERFRQAMAEAEAARAAEQHKPTVARSLAQIRADLEQQKHNRKAAG